MARSTWFFAILAMLGIIAIIVPWVFNRSIQLSASQVEQAIALWKSTGPKDYDLEILESSEPGGVKKQLLLKVRAREVTSLVIDGNFVTPGESPRYQVLDLLEQMSKTLIPTSNQESLSSPPLQFPARMDTLFDMSGETRPPRNGSNGL